MKAIILVGGLGTRLRPLTCNIPKAIVPILNRPFLEHLLLYLKHYGISDIILAMGYNPAPIKAALGNGSKLGIHLTYLIESSPLGTAGAVKNAEALLDGSFIVLNGDILTEIDLSAMIEQHKKSKSAVSIALTPVENPTIYGVVETDSNGMAINFIEKPPPDRVTTNMINAGIYIIEPEVLGRIPPHTPYMFEKGLFPTLLAEGITISGYKSEAYWIDIGTPEKYLKANHDLLINHFNGEIKITGHCQIHPSAIIEGPVLIGDACEIAENAVMRGPSVLGSGCKLGRNAVIESSVLWESVQIEHRANITNSIIGSASHIMGSQSIYDCIIGDNLSIEAGRSVLRGSILWPDGWTESA
ncbi:MAG TPA: NDP-sugar synthase [Dehalococcoidia bacterium]|nr:NDP-sugar synthase [Dehalococcoidia bacterium]